MTAPTLCYECDNVEAGSRKTNPRNWLCRMHKRRHAEGFISPTYWAENEPFLRCVNVNAGSCPLFTPLRKPAGSHRETNLAPALVEAHREKTKAEASDRAKADRIRRKANGTWPRSKSPLRSRPFPTSRRSGDVIEA